MTINGVVNTAQSRFASTSSSEENRQAEQNVWHVAGVIFTVEKVDKRTKEEKTKQNNNVDTELLGALCNLASLKTEKWKREKDDETQEDFQQELV